MKNQKGFSPVEIVLTLVIVGLIGGTGWYVYQAKQNSDKSLDSASQQSIKAGTKETQSNDPYKDWKSYSKYGITFKYPANWSFKTFDNTQSMATEVSSPDFNTDETVRDSSGARRPQAGGKVTIDYAGFDMDGLTVDNFEEKALKTNPNGYRDFKITTINGKKAVQYRYDGTAEPLTVFFLPDNVQVWVHLDYAIDSTSSLDTYNQIVKTVTY